MHKGNWMPRAGALLLTLVAVGLGVAGCGGSSDNAVGLLRATFSGSHQVKSGKLNVALLVNP